jgi:hypothetical protein
MNNHFKKPLGLFTSGVFALFSLKKYPLSAKTRLLILVLLISTILAAGCRPMVAGRTTANESNHFYEQKALEKGYMVFQIRRFKQAEKIFSALQSSVDREISKKARYALACTRWALAETPEAEKEALDRWKKSRNRRHKYGDSDDFKLLEILLEIVSNRSCQEGKAKEVSDQTGESNCQAVLRLRDEEIRRLNQRIKTMKWHVILLKKKINSIAEIAQKKQEKKENPPPP